MKDFLQEYFYYSRSERNGLLVLATICVILVISPAIYKHLFKTPTKTDFSEYQSQINAFYKSQNQASADVPQATISLFDFNPNTASVDDFQRLGLSPKVASTIENYRNKGGKFFKKEDFKKIYGITEDDYKRLENFIILKDRNQDFKRKDQPLAEGVEPVFELFNFDPNTVSKEELLRLGLSKKAANIMLNYRNKGGTFRKREDLSKIYGITEADFERLFPYIQIAEKHPAAILASNETPDVPAAYASYEPVKIEINSATPEEWQQLRGIGAYYSKKICSYREKLGGFIAIAQVGEAYGIPDSTFQKIKPFLFLDQAAKKININIATAKELAAHPYLRWNQANAIIKYRGQHGEFASLEQLANVKALTPAALAKIKPYLALE